MTVEKATITIVVSDAEVVNGLVKDLLFVQVKNDKIKMFTRSDILREALLKGLNLMYLERARYQELVDATSDEGAKRIYTSLINGKGISQTTSEESVKEGE